MDRFWQMRWSQAHREHHAALYQQWLDRLEALNYEALSPADRVDYHLLHTVPKDVVREALNNLIVRCDQLWVFGNLSLGVKVQIGIAKRLGKPVRYYDITDLPYRVVSVPESMVSEERRD